MNTHNKSLNLIKLKEKIDSFLSFIQPNIDDSQLEPGPRIIVQLWLQSGILLIGDYYDIVIDIVSDFDAINQIDNQTKAKIIETLLDLKIKHTNS